MHAIVVVVSKGRLEVLVDQTRAVRICEEYANGGIDELKVDKPNRGSERYEDSIDRLARGAA